MCGIFRSGTSREGRDLQRFSGGRGVGEDGFEFFADLVAAVEGEGAGTMASWSGRRFEGEEVAFGGGFSGFLAASSLLLGGAGDSVRMRRSWPCLARPPSGVSKMRLISWTRSETGLAPSLARVRRKDLGLEMRSLISISGGMRNCKADGEE